MALSFTLDPLTIVDSAIRQVGEDRRAAQNRAFQSEEAQKNRDFQMEMYDRQLDDSIAWREHQEMYNSPEAQMKRYRDAGINPMYAVTGSGQNTVTTPMSMTSGYGTSTPSGSRSSIVSQPADRLIRSQVETNEALAHKYNAEASEAVARAEGINHDNVGKRISALINERLERMNLTSPTGEADSASFVEFKANAIAQAEEFAYEFNQMNFWDAKDKFEHLRVVRQFEQDLQNHERAKFRYQLSQAKSAADLFAVSARWAVANQWINASSEVLGAAASLIGSVKGTAMMPTFSRNFTESYGDHTSTTYNYNKRVGNEIQSPESMMRTLDLP